MVKRIPISQKVKWWTAKRESEEVIVLMNMETTKLYGGKDLYFVHKLKGGKSE
jgi:hypothetical protein